MLLQALRCGARSFFCRQQLLLMQRRLADQLPASSFLQLATALGLREARLRSREGSGTLAALLLRLIPLGFGGVQPLQSLHRFLQRLPLLGADTERLQALLQLLLALLALGQKLTLPGHALPQLR
ncbi:hypothetical protein D3C78_1239980 [compost metagenome]